MHYLFTPGARRALASASAWSGRKDRDELEASAVLLGLLAEGECRAAAMLAGTGIDASAVRKRWPDLTPCAAPAADASVPFSPDVELSLQVAAERLAEYPQPLELATEHVLLGLVAAEHQASAWLRQEGLDPAALEAEIHRLYGHHPGPLPLDLPQEQSDSLSRRERAGVRGERGRIWSRGAPP